MRSLIICLILSGLFLSSYAQENDGIWEKANKLYQQEQYDSAVHYYELLTQNSTSAALYHNLGNTYYRLNKISNAILSYEKSLKLDPGNTETQDNLYLTQGRINNRIQPVDKIFFIKWWQSLTHGNNATLWSILALLIFLGVITIYSLKKLNIIALHIPQQVLIGAIAIWVFLITFATTATNNKTNSHEAIVMKSDAAFKTHADATKIQSLIPEGTKVSLGQKQLDWVEVTLPDGRRGWMKGGILVKI